MRTVVEHIFVLLYDVILVAGAGNLLIVAASVGQLSAIDRVVQNTAHKCGGEAIQRVIYDKYIHTTMGVSRIAAWLNEHGYQKNRSD